MGKQVKVVKAANASLVGINGVVVDESAGFITVQTTQGIKRVPKRGSVLELNGEEVAGDSVLASPVERMKLKVD